MGFVATRDLVKDEELTRDYGCPPQGQPWLMKYPKVCVKICYWNAVEVAKHLNFNHS